VELLQMTSRKGAATEWFLDTYAEARAERKREAAARRRPLGGA